MVILGFVCYKHAAPSGAVLAARRDRKARGARSVLLGGWSLMVSLGLVCYKYAAPNGAISPAPRDRKARRARSVRLGGWSLDFGASLVLGCWCLEFFHN